MSTRAKILERFKAKPKDFSWKELEHLLFSFGYIYMSSGKTSGSRVKFMHEYLPVIFLHRPHPSRMLKRYQIEYLHDLFMNENLL